MRRIISVLFLCIVLGRLHVRADCILSEICDKNYVKIVANPPMKGELNSEALRILENRCADLYHGKSPPEVCCTSEQLVEMNKKFKDAETIFGRCPTCIQNMLKSICALTCSPHQDRFLSVANVTKNNKCANLVNFRIDPDYMKKTFDSCSGITSPLTGGSVMEIACGAGENSFTCTAEKWYKFLGHFDDKFKINYVSEKNESRRFEYPAKFCNESYDNSYACSCVDCQITCDRAEQPRGMIQGLNINRTMYILLVILIFLCLVPGILYFLSNSTVGTSKGFLSIDKIFKEFFTKWGETIAENPIPVLLVFVVLVVGLGFGTMFIQVTTDPVKLWAASDSLARQEKEYFDSKFGPFFRTEQLFLKPIYEANVTYFDKTANKTVVFGPAFNFTFLREALVLQQELLNLGTNESEGLETICYAPVLEKNEPAKLENCVVQSIFGYIQNDENELTENYEFLEGLFECIRNPFNHACLSTWKGPAIPELVLGGYPQVPKGTPPEYNLATVLTITIIVKNFKESELLEPALKWEERFIEFLSKYESPLFKLVFKAERSIEDGIQEMSNAEFLTVIVSYSLMFLYIVFSLGRIRNCNSFFIESKITLAGGGIVIVMASVFCSLGLFGYVGVSTTMLTIEVIPFLVLAVGVDNIFILVQTYNRLDKDKYKNVSEALGAALGDVGPSLLLTAATECFCFSIGSLSNMPAVKTFAYFATVAILLDFLFQITAFLALIALDEKRFRAQRFDLFCCFKGKIMTNSVKNRRGVTEKIFDLFFTPLLMSKPMQVIVMLTMVLWTSFSILVTPLVQPGLDQSLSMPKDSYIAEYFLYLEKYFNVGPPVYFVLKPGLNFSEDEDQNLVCGGIRCNANSLIGQINAAVLDSERSKISKISNSWLDDYFDWIKSDNCCKETANGGFCPSNNETKNCHMCSKNIALNKVRPTKETFEKFFDSFLSDLPGESCFKGGRATYADGIVYEPNSELKIKDTYFMTYHTPLKTSKDYYSALEQARKISGNMNVMFKQHGKDVKVFPYSIFYVFYEQYLTMWNDVAISLGLSLLTVFLVTLTVTGFDFVSALMVLYMVALILVNMGGLMWLFNISLNAISLVNLVVCVGIGVEFVSHIVWAYTQTNGSRQERASHTLTTTGSSVLSGIALTKFCGIIVLAFAKSQIFRVFYFQMYLGMVLIGAVHGLIFLPVLLCYFGPNSKQIKKNAKEEMVENDKIGETEE